MYLAFTYVSLMETEHAKKDIAVVLLLLVET